MAPDGPERCLYSTTTKQNTKSECSIFKSPLPLSRTQTLCYKRPTSNRERPLPSLRHPLVPRWTRVRTSLTFGQVRSRSVLGHHPEDPATDIVVVSGLFTSEESVTDTRPSSLVCPSGFTGLTYIISKVSLSHTPFIVGVWGGSSRHVESNLIDRRRTVSVTVDKSSTVLTLRKLGRTPAGLSTLFLLWTFCFRAGYPPD